MEADNLDEIGMVLDFDVVAALEEHLDHSDLNETLKPINPTSENVAKYIYERMNNYLLQADCQDDVKVTKVRVSEMPNSWAELVP